MGEDKEGRASILIVEDDRSLRETLSLILEKNGFHVETAGTGQEALAKIQERFFNVVLLDIRLPDKEGVDLISPMREIHRELEIIVMTGQATLDTAVRALNEGAAAYVTKPLDMDDVLGRIRAFVEKQHLASENRRLYQEAQREIEERKRAEEELKSSRRLLSTVIETVPHSIFVTNLDGQYQLVNRAYSELLGEPIPELINKTIFETKFGTRTQQQKAVEDDQAVIRTGKSVETKNLVMAGTDGITRIYNLIKIPLIDAGRNVTGIVGISEDITERKAIETLFQQAQKMEAVGTLAGGIAHSFNNLLQMIMGNVSLLLMETNSNDPQHEILSAIKNGVKSGSELTKQLLGFARGGKYQVKPSDLSALLLRTSYLFGSAHAEISIHKKLETELWVSKVDQNQIEQVLLNLFVNSQEAMPHGGKLFLQSENVTLDDSFAKLHGVTPGKYVKMSVRDTGTGMDQEILARIFEPFFTTKEMARGSGLGLASAYGIIKNHEGIITVDSEVGKGTTFDMYLPATEEIPEIKQSPKAELHKGTGAILFVDDDEDLVAFARRALGRFLGYKVFTAKSGAEAIEVYSKRENEINLVVLDLMMPEMGGGETFDKLRELNPKVKVLLSSGYSLEGEAAEIMERGCDGFIQKPFDPGELSEQIHKVLDQK